MAELKTKPTNASVAQFLARVPKEKRDDAKRAVALMQEVTGQKPRMWGTAIVGFGMYHYKSERSSQEGDWPLTAFSPRKQTLTFYVMPGFAKSAALLKKLGPHKTSVGCLYIKRLDDIHVPTLKKIVKRGYTEMKKRYAKK